MAVTREILNSHPIGNLKKEIAKTNIRGYSKMKKSELVDVMIKNKERFGHIKHHTKAKAEPKAKPVKKEKIPFKIKEKTFSPNKKYPKVFRQLLNNIDDSGYFSDTKYFKRQKDKSGKPFLLTPEKNEATPIVNQYIDIVEKSSFGKNLLSIAEKSLPIKPFTDNASIETLDQNFNHFLGVTLSDPKTFENLKPKPANASVKNLGELFEERSRIIESSNERAKIIKKHKDLVSYFRSKPTQAEVNRAVDSDREYQVVKGRLESMYGNYLKKRSN